MLISTRPDCMARRLDSGDSAQRFANNQIPPHRPGALLAARSLLSIVSVERILLRLSCRRHANGLHASMDRWHGTRKGGRSNITYRLPASRSADLPFTVWSSGVGVCVHDALSFCISDGAKRTSSLGFSPASPVEAWRARSWALASRGQDEGWPCLPCVHMTCAARFSARCAVPQYVPGISRADKLGLMLWVG